MKRKLIFCAILTVAAVTGVRDVANELSAISRFASGLAKATSCIGITTVQANGPVKRSEELIGSTADPQERSAEFHWTGSIATGRTVEIKGVNGSIAAEAASGNQVEVSATKTGRRSDPAEVNVRVVEHPNGVTICAVYPSSDPGNPNTCEPGGGGHMNTRNNDVKVDFVVRVPAGVHFNGRTVNGGVEVRSLGGNVDASTVNGEVNISTAGYAQARTVNGSIKTQMGRADWPKTLGFKTVNGGIELELPADLNTKVQADTVNGQITTDFPLTVLGSFSRHHTSGTIGIGGAGERELVLKTVNGTITLHRLGQ
jgi:hypothetical protein